MASYTLNFLNKHLNKHKPNKHYEKMKPKTCSFTADNTSKNLKIVSVFSPIMSNVGYKVHSEKTFMECKKIVF